MTRILWLVCDQSGSMREEARRFIVRNLVRCTEQFVRLRPGRVEDVKLVGLRDTAMVVDWAADEEFPDRFMDCHATLDASDLSGLSGVSPSDKVLVFTDGSWSAAAVAAIDSWRRENELSVRFAKVGSDTRTRLTGQDVFAAEDLVGVLEEWLTP